MPWPKKDATPYLAQLGPPDKGHSIEGLVVCGVVESMKGMGLRICIGQGVRVSSLVVVRMVTGLKNGNDRLYTIVFRIVNNCYNLLGNFYRSTGYG